MDNSLDNTPSPQKAWHKRPVGIIFIFLLSWIVMSIQFGGDKTGTPVTQTGTSASVAPAPKPIDPAVLEANKKELTELKNKFSYEYDEFDKIGWYKAKTQVVDHTWDENLLKVYVNNTGYCYLADQYYGDNWIFHTRVEVKIGDTIYKSEDIPSYDPNNKHENSSGSVWETISYTKGKDNGIIKAIAESGDATIRVRFTGDQMSRDFTLSKRDQQAIKDAYRLSELLKK